ncbi:MAG: GNAT family N-acetyltransferase [Gaiellales bacterium]
MSEPRLRAPTERDIPAIVGCFASAFGDERLVDDAEVRGWLASGELDEDLVCVLEVNGAVVGYGDLIRVPRNDELEVCIAAAGHEVLMLDWAERVAGLQRTGGTRAYVPEGHPLEERLRERGYRYWLSSLTMRIELDDDPPSRSIPPLGVELHSYRPRDVGSVIELLNEAFVDDPFHRELTEASFVDRLVTRPGFDPAHWHLARAGDEVVGVALALPPRPGGHAIGHVDSLAVRDTWRRRGVGECLMRRAIRELHTAGVRTVELGVVAGNPTGAVRLYERVGMTAVARWNNWVLRFIDA